MSFSDSMFLFEINVEKLKSFIKCKEYLIKSEFGDVFMLYLKDPRIMYQKTLNERKKQVCKKSKVRKASQRPVETTIQIGQSALLGYDANMLITKMKNFPMIISIWRKSNPLNEIGSVHMIWDDTYMKFLSKSQLDLVLNPLTLTKELDIFNKVTSQLIASITVNIKLSHLRHEETAKLRSTNLPPVFKYSAHKIQETKMAAQRLDNKLNKKHFHVVKNIHSKQNKISKGDIKHNKLIIKEFEGRFRENSCESNMKMHNEYKMAKNEFSLVRSNIEISKKQCVDIMKTRSNSFIEGSKQLNILNYIFGGDVKSFGNQVYYVGYFTVNEDKGQGSSNSSNKDFNHEKTSGSRARFQSIPCDVDCVNKRELSNCSSQSGFSANFFEEISPESKIVKCKDILCENKEYRVYPPAQDCPILLNLDNYKKDCCKVTEETIEVVGGVSAKMQFTNDPCFCTCECTFGFTKKTTYCGVCGGYEKIGEDLAHKLKTELPFPCPIFHKLVDKNKLKSYSSGSDSKKRDDSIGPKSMKMGSKSRTSSDKRSIGERKSIEPEKDDKKRKVRNDDRFKFNYGYKGIPPQIGHSQCAMPCLGTLSAVPKRMGWLWTAENVPGIKFHPQWKPGAISKFVHRLLKMAKNPDEVISKKKRKDTGKKKRPLKRPLLVVHKQNGEFTVTMETMKNYSKPRQLNQHPYEDKPVMTYTIGRTEAKNRARQKKKEREQRRLERAQRNFIQSTFKNMCQEICLKTYEQALGILPNAEDPNCPCYPAEPGPDRVNLDLSCSCSEEKSSFGSDTDSDEWVVEFTPPNAKFDPTFKPKKIFKVDNSTQYTYLDYRVKLIDRYGNPVPRFFKGPDGKQQCSDLGGFWSPDHHWLEINIDGYIAPDNRWAPNTFIGPQGDTVDAETGKFQVANGKWLVVGVDGFIDSHGKWCFYPRPKSIMSHKKKQKISGAKKGDTSGKIEHAGPVKPSEATWSCFGDVLPEKLYTKMGIVGHGKDRKLLMKKIQELRSQGKDVKIPQPNIVPHFHKPSKTKGTKTPNPKSFTTELKCHHSIPSDKGIQAVDEYGNKTFFRLKKYKNKRPKQRIANLTKQGISLSSFHIPCFHSFIDSETMKKQQRDRLEALASKYVNVRA